MSEAFEEWEKTYEARDPATIEGAMEAAFAAGQKAEREACIELAHGLARQAADYAVMSSDQGNRRLVETWESRRQGLTDLAARIRQRGK